jgi:uncharacterized protein
MLEHGAYTAYIGNSLIASGSIEEILPILKKSFDRDRGAMILTFHDQTGEPVDFDLRGSLSEVQSRVVRHEPRSGPGRPKLGVVAREISLLPRHWDWLSEQPNGASAAIRRLIDEEGKRSPDKAARRIAMKVTGRVMSAIAGNFPGYEEASRALYAADGERFHSLIASWPADVRDYLKRLIVPVFLNPSGS